MSAQGGYHLLEDADDETVLQLQGDWLQGGGRIDTRGLRRELGGLVGGQLIVDGAALGEWDSRLPAFLLQCHDLCRDQDIEYQHRNMPDGLDQLLAVATAVPAHKQPQSSGGGFWARFNPEIALTRVWTETRDSLAFVGEVNIALWRLITGRANTRWVDFKGFVFQAGPDALPIISLVGILVGMILAYLGAVQLAQFGAEIYVADLVLIGMLREMGVLMTAVVMAGRTGAAYAAQLGTMQTNEEIDAISTMGVSPMEFLVLPRMLALVLVMPLLTLYANLLGVIGGAIVSGGLGITPLQYIAEAETVLEFSHLAVGLIKSVIFGMLIAVAGCRAGINSGRSSAAVGDATTKAVVTAVIYLIIADATINIVFQQLDM
ncbi:MAG: ABC transporter permease [Pseudomonadota bacterium]